MINAIGSNVWVGIQELGGKAQNWMLTSSTGGATFTQTALTGTGHMAGFIFNVPTTDGINVFAMWIQKSGTGSVAVVSSSTNGGNTWSAATQLGQSDPNNDVAIGSIASDGMHGLAAWDNSSTIWFSRAEFPNGGYSGPPHLIIRKPSTTHSTSTGCRSLGQENPQSNDVDYQSSKI